MKKLPKLVSFVFVAGFLLFPVFVFAVDFLPNPYVFNSNEPITIGCENSEDTVFYWVENWVGYNGHPGGLYTIYGGDFCSGGYELFNMLQEGGIEAPTKIYFIETETDTDCSPPDSFEECKEVAGYVGEDILDVVIAGGGYNILPVTGASVENALDTTRQFSYDLRFLIALAVGLPIGFYLIEKIIDIVTKRTEKDDS